MTFTISMTHLKFLDKEEFSRYRDSSVVEPREKEIYNANLNYYEIKFSNVGGLVMPIILQLNYDDGTNFTIKIPAEIWKMNRKQITKIVATKKQAKDIVAQKADSVNMPYITERWPGGMLTNFVTIRKAVKKMNAIDRMKADGTFETLSKKEKLQVDRQRAKLEKNLGSISDMTRLPGAIFVVDTLNEKISVQEAQKLNIPIFAMVDTNSDPNEVDFIIPSNDDASKSIEKILDIVCNAIQESLEERKKEKEIAEQKKLEEAETATEAADTDASEKE